MSIAGKGWLASCKSFASVDVFAKEGDNIFGEKGCVYLTATDWKTMRELQLCKLIAIELSHLTSGFATIL